MKRKYCRGTVAGTGERVIVFEVSPASHDTTTLHSQTYRTEAPDGRPIFVLEDGRQLDCQDQKHVDDPMKSRWFIRDHDAVWKELKVSPLDAD